VEDPTANRYRPRDYLETLEQRIAYLEGVLKQYRPELAEDHLVQANPPKPIAPNSSFAMPVTERKSGLPPPSNNDEPDELDELAAKAGLLGLNAAGAEPHYLGSSSIYLCFLTVDPLFASPGSHERSQ
jgi:hypothetical protein